MSLKTWKAEYYPTEAYEATDNDLQAALHSLKKWEGLTPRNLAEHGGVASDGELIFKGDEFELSDENCALCQRSELEFGQQDGYCAKCPLWKVRGEMECYKKLPSEGLSPWHTMLEHGDPRPMIYWLKKTVEHVKNIETEGSDDS